ncbi:hypothetical protein C2S51_026424 [Perilla frutescens var. frutescens]|nr:hypothetical protein C2S51_026424 [Perilla frutescens var. frutescens]
MTGKKCSTSKPYDQKQVVVKEFEVVKLTEGKRIYEIPCSIGEIPTLVQIEVYKCSPSAEASVKQTMEVQQSEYNNYDLQVRINANSGFLSSLRLPPPLKKLTLNECVITTEFMTTTLCELPNLQVLKMRKCEFKRQENTEVMVKEWEQTVFGEEDCPCELREIGRKIARDCGGLPLAINVIGGILFKAERARDVWEHVAKDVRATIAETDNHEFSNVLTLSYNHLPNNLKPCFLYMGAFLENYEIKASRLIQVWIAEGFFKSKGYKRLEKEAEENLKALVERNLVLVRRKKSNGKACSYGMHDLLREVCIRKADKEKFLLHVKNGSEVRLDKVRRVSVETSCLMKDVEANASAELSVARSFILATPYLMFCEKPSLLFCKLRLVRVLDVYEMKFPEFPREIYQLVNLRYLGVSCKSGGIPTGISRLWNLQTLIARVDWGAIVPSEIWEMSELTHLKLSNVFNIEEGYMIKFVRKKLQTIFYWVRITPSLMRRGFFESIPNIKILGVYFPELASSIKEVDLTHLHKLQTLRCASQLNKDPFCRFHLTTLRFPSSLRKLHLYRCAIFGRFMTTLCALPNLEVLKIENCIFDEYEEWEAAEGDVFMSLQFLQLQEVKLVLWRANETNFPRLQELRIVYCSLLVGIPSGIGEIPTLQLIQVYECSPSVVASAKQIQKLQQSEFDNYDLKLELYDD